MIKGQTIEPKIPCAHCGGMKLSVAQSKQWGYFVRCRCHATGPNASSPDEAVRLWDHRVVQTSLDDLVLPSGGGGSR